MTAFDRTKPYNDLTPLPPNVTIETPAVLKKAITASRALAELKGAGREIPDQRILINSIVLQEARLSSEIENIVTTSDEVYRALESEKAATPQAKEVLRYRDALWRGFETLEKRPLSVRTMEDIVRTFRETDAGVRKVPGTRVSNAAGEVIYTPPEGETLIREKLANLERFMHADDDLDPLIRMAVAHYQFEAIHPFTDGNGRAGRIINVVFLVERELLEVPVLYLSRYILQHRAAYYDGLRRVTEEAAWEPWVLYMLDAVEETSRDTRQRIDRIRRALEETQELVRKKAPKIYSKDLVETIFRQPYTKIGFLVEAGIAARLTASKYLQALEKIGVLRSARSWKDVYYVNHRLLRALSS